MEKPEEGEGDGQRADGDPGVIPAHFCDGRKDVPGENQLGLPVRQLKFNGVFFPSDFLDSLKMSKDPSHLIEGKVDFVEKDGE